MRIVSLVIAGVVAAGPLTAQADPKFEYAKPEEVKVVEWKASAQAGLILTTGNSRSTSLSASLTASRKAGDNKLSLDAAGAYARSRIFIAEDANMNGTIGENEIDETTQTTTRNWLLKLRYDRFFGGGANSAYLTGKLGADKPAGKEIFGGGQIGYSRQLFKNADHEVVAEAGYDFTYESYVADVKSLQIHSARVFAGWTGKLSEDTGLLANIEALFNLNTEDGPTGDIKAFDDTRINAKAAITTKIWKRMDFRFGLTLKYDNAPAPQPPYALPYDAGFVPLADKTDLTAEAALIVNLL